MKQLILIATVTYMFASCDAKKNENLYDFTNYIRVTSDEDSIQERRVIYEFKGDKKRQMLRTYYDDGSILAINYFHNKMKSGPSKQFMDSKIYFEGNYLEGKKVDTHYYYFSNGKPKIIEVYNNDTLIQETQYTEQGDILFIDRKKH